MKNIQIIDCFPDKYTDQLLGLFKREWWSKNRTSTDVSHLLEHSDLNITAIETSKETLVGYSRVLTDYKYFAFIFDVIVDASYRRQGVGSKLLEYILKHARIKDCHSIELCCPPEREEFYRKFGFNVSAGRMRLKHHHADF